MREPQSWDIFCRVVDNFGDAGVCWRLANLVATEHGGRVRLWIDDLDSLHRLNPAVRLVSHQHVEGIEVYRWASGLKVPAPAQVVIEAFGCGLPDEYLSLLERSDRRSLWIVLEYLSAEPWVAAHHGLASPHPRSPAERYFFFPGFVPGTGGLLREAGLFARRDRFDEAAQRSAFWRSLGHEATAPGAIAVSLFAYEEAPILELLRQWEHGRQPIVAAVPDSRLLPRVLQHFGESRNSALRVLRRGALEVRLLPFLPQKQYDELLWACDCNFVRGEESFVRAQWAARPFVWHIYPQQDGAHQRKLEAFLALYGEGLPRAARSAADDLMRAWNQFETPGVSAASAWTAYTAQLDTLRRHGRMWAGRLAEVGSLTGNLVWFCRQRLEKPVK